MKNFKDFLVEENTTVEDDGVLLPEGFVYGTEPLLEGGKGKTIKRKTGRKRKTIKRRKSNN